MKPASGYRGSGTEESASLSETSDSRSVSTCKKIYHPKQWRLQMKKQQWMKGDQKEGTQKESPPCSIDGPPSILKYAYNPWNVRKDNLNRRHKYEYIPGMFERAISSVKHFCYS